RGAVHSRAAGVRHAAVRAAGRPRGDRHDPRADGGDPAPPGAGDRRRGRDRAGAQPGRGGAAPAVAAGPADAAAAALHGPAADDAAAGLAGGLSGEARPRGPRLPSPPQNRSVRGRSYGELLKTAPYVAAARTENFLCRRIHAVGAASRTSVPAGTGARPVRGTSRSPAVDRARAVANTVQ